MSSSREFELVFEGPADESADTLRKLRTSLLADAGLSVPEAQEVLSNTPKTIKTSELEDDLKPLYAALKKAGGKVLIVRPAEATNDKAYFLDLEDSPLDEDLLKSLEALPGDDDTATDDIDVAVDLTQELKDFVPAEDVTAPVVATTPEIQVTPALQPPPTPVVAAPIATTPEPEPIPAPVVAVPPVIAANENISGGASSCLPLNELTPSIEQIGQTEQNGQAGACPSKEPEAPPPADKPLFEFATPAAELEKPVPAPGSPEAANSVVPEDKPLFEFGSAAELATESKVEEVAAPVVQAGTIQPSLLDDLTLSLDEPSPAPPAHEHATSASPVTEAQATPAVAPGDSFSTDDLSLSLNQQLESEKSRAPEVSTPKAPAALSLSVDAEPAVTPPPAVSVKSREPAKHVPPAPAPPSPNIVIEREGAAVTAAPAEDEAENLPPPVPFKSAPPKDSPSMDLILPILVGAILLGIANWLYFESDQGEINLPKISFGGMEEQKEGDLLRREIVPTTEKKIGGKTQDGELSLAWTIVFDKGELKNVSIEATTPQPPDLTPEQIVRAERPTPWLYKIEVNKFPFEKQLDGTWQAKGPARVFVSQGTSKRRLVAQAEITLASFKADESVVGEVVITRGMPNSPSKAPFHFEQLINGDILLYVSSQLN